MRRPRYRTYRTIDVRTVFLAFSITVEQGRNDLERQCSGDEQRTTLESFENGFAERDCYRITISELRVTLDGRGQIASAAASISPIRCG